MHTRTRTIVENLSIDANEIEKVYNTDKTLNVKTIKKLEQLGMPESAIEQIKFFEMLSTDFEKSLTKDEWIAWLLRKTKKSLTAFMKKKIPAKIIFTNLDWCIYADTYSKPVLQLHRTCKAYFDEFASKNLDLLIDLTGNELLLKE